MDPYTCCFNTATDKNAYYASLNPPIAPLAALNHEKSRCRTKSGWEGVFRVGRRVNISVICSAINPAHRNTNNWHANCVMVYGRDAYVFNSQLYSSAAIQEVLRQQNPNAAPAPDPAYQPVPAGQALRIAEIQGSRIVDRCLLHSQVTVNTPLQMCDFRHIPQGANGRPLCLSYSVQIALLAAIRILQDRLLVQPRTGRQIADSIANEPALQPSDPYGVVRWYDVTR